MTSPEWLRPESCTAECEACLRDASIHRLAGIIIGAALVAVIYAMVKLWRRRPR